MVVPAGRDTSECSVYHGAGTEPAAFGDDTSRWHTVDELLEKKGDDVRKAAVLIVDASMLGRLELHRVPRHVIFLAADDPSEEALRDRLHTTVAGFEEIKDRARVLRVTCRAACVRAISMRRRRELARSNRELRDLNQIGMALMQERDLGALLHRILELGKALTGSDGGALFLADTKASPPELILRHYQFDSIPDLVYSTGTVPIDDRSILGHSARIKEPVVIADAYDLPPDAGFLMEPTFDQRYPYRRRSMLFVPMVDHRDHLVGLLGLVNRKSDPRARITSKEAADRFVLPYTDREVRLARSLASQAAVSLENAALYMQIERTLEGVVKAAGRAVDQRDPTTAGHSLRVAELAVTLAAAVEQAKSGPYEHVHFTSRQIRELRLAAQLHDVGKVAVREDVLMKAKKLPPVLWERVDARFDLIRRTLELENCRSGKGETEITPQLDELARMRAIVRAANEPTVLEEGPAAALRDIAQRTFERPDGSVMNYLTDEELHYLQLARGTLDDRERAEIESHAEATYQILSDIPWTDDLKNLADYAHGHHEKLDGAGYPRRLKADEIPIQTRLITLADMFDALTASDRPYKPAVPASQALDILQSEADAGRIDADLLRIMVESEAYRKIVEQDWRRF